MLSTTARPKGQEQNRQNFCAGFMILQSKCIVLDKILNTMNEVLS